MYINSIQKKMRPLFVLIMFFALVSKDSLSQKVYSTKDIKALKKEIVFSEKFKYVHNASARWIFKQKRTGQAQTIDTISVLLKKNKSLSLKNEMLISYEGDYTLHYSGDSIFTKSASAGEYMSFADKGFRRILSGQNFHNPYYKRQFFFLDLMKSRVFEVSDTTFVFTFKESTKEVDRKVIYTFLKMDTSLVQYKVIFNPKVHYLSHIVEECDYLSLEKDLPNFSLIDSMPDYKPKQIKTYASNLKLKLEVGETFPDMKLSNLKGDSIYLKTLAAKYYLLDFWYIGCVPCMKALPFLEEIHLKYPELEVLGINTKNQLLTEVEVFVRKNQVEYKMFSSTGFMSRADMAYPTFVLLDKDLKILYVKSGYHKSFIDDIKAFLN